MKPPHSYTLLVVHITTRYRLLINNFCCYPEIGKTVALIGVILVILWISFTGLLGQLVNNSAAVFRTKLSS
jgi:hypothetical protein